MPVFTVTGRILSARSVSILTTLRIRYLGTRLSTTLPIDNGIGFCVTNPLAHGRSMCEIPNVCSRTKWDYSAAPAGIPSIVSRLVTAEYFSRQCGLFFPPVDGFTYASAHGTRANAVNAWTHGWYGTTERVMWAQGYVFQSWLRFPTTNGETQSV